jgi:hypothetical protein
MIQTQEAQVVIDALFDHAYHSKDWETSHDVLTKGDRMVMSVSTYLGELCNGGFDQYFWNDAGDFCFDAAETLDAIGAPEYREFLTRAMSLFPYGGPSTDRLTRQDQLEVLRSGSKCDVWEQLETEFFQRYHSDREELTRKLFAYIREHTNEFSE